MTRKEFLVSLAPVDEHVLVIPTPLFHQLGQFQGFCRDIDRYLEPLLQSDQASYRPRSQMETDPSFKQLIPYVLFQYCDPEGTVHLFQYLRGGGQGEARLHSKRSVGVGGHISSEDANSGNAYLEGMQRELDEEVVVDTNFNQRCVGLINDDENEVGQVHLGVVHLCDVDKPEVCPRESELLEAGFRPVSELLQELDSFETWSQICLQALYLEESLAP